MPNKYPHVYLSSPLKKWAAEYSIEMIVKKLIKDSQNTCTHIQMKIYVHLIMWYLYLYHIEQFCNWNLRWILISKCLSSWREEQMQTWVGGRKHRGTIYTVTLWSTDSQGGRNTSRSSRDAFTVNTTHIPTQGESKRHSSVPMFISSQRVCWWYPHLSPSLSLFPFSAMPVVEGVGVTLTQFIMVEVTITLITSLHTL